MTRTSATHPIHVDWLPDYLTAPGRLGLTFAPGKRCASGTGPPWWRELAPDLARLRQHHRVDTLVCLMEPAEMAHVGIPSLRVVAAAREARLEHLAFPIRDLSVPTLHVARGVLDELHGKVDAGRRVVVHCLGGLGRTGTVVGCYLVEIGMTPMDALRMLAAVRGPRCPETVEQATFVRRWRTR